MITKPNEPTLKQMIADGDICTDREYILLDTFSWTNGAAASLSTMCDTDTDASRQKCKSN